MKGCHKGSLVRTRLTLNDPLSFLVKNQVKTSSHIATFKCFISLRDISIIAARTVHGLHMS